MSFSSCSGKAGAGQRVEKVTKHLKRLFVKNSVSWFSGVDRAVATGGSCRGSASLAIAALQLCWRTASRHGCSSTKTGPMLSLLNGEARHRFLSVGSLSKLTCNQMFPDIFLKRARPHQGSSPSLFLQAEGLGQPEWFLLLPGHSLL